MPQTRINAITGDTMAIIVATTEPIIAYRVWSIGAGSLPVLLFFVSDCISVAQ